MKEKKIIKKVSIPLFLLSLFVLPTLVLAWGTMSIQTWDLVDSGKHLDYVNNSKYAVEDGISVWDSYKPNIIRKDSWNTINDVTYSDVSSLGGDIVGQTNSGGTIKFADNYMSTYSYSQRKNVIIHETGHALRLGHRGETDSVMQEYVTSITTLSIGDQRNFDYAYDNYY